MPHFITGRAAHIKPPVGTGIDWGHPLAHGMRLYWSPTNDHGTVHEEVTGRRTTWNAQPVGVSNYGGGCRFSANTQWALLANTVGISAASAITIMVESSATAYATVTPACAVAIEGNTSANLIAFYPWDGSSGNGCRIFWNSATTLDQNSRSMSANGILRRFLFTSRSSTDHQLFVEGLSVATSSTSKTVPTLTNGVRIASYNAGQTMSEAANGSLFRVVIWSRGFTPSEAQWLHAEPYSFILPAESRKRYFLADVPVSTGQPFAKRLSTIPHLGGSLRQARF